MSIQRTLGHSPEFALSITDDNISEGIERNSNHCMVADAIKEARPNLKYIAVDIQTIRATDREKKERYVWLTPRSIQQLIIDFDAGNKSKIRPFKATLRMGQTVTAGKSEQEKKKQNRARAKLRKPPRNKLNGPGAPLVRVGGKTPPRAIGQRRQFGLRSLVY